MSKYITKHLFRPIPEDKIQYFLIGQRPLLVDFEVPEIFQSNLLDLILYMPKSIVQIINPSLWHEVNKKNNISFHTEFKVLFDDYSREKYKFSFQIPSKVLVFFLNTPNQEIFEIIEGLSRCFIISSNDEKIYSKILASDNLKDKAFLTYKDFSKKILNIALKELNINPDSFANIRQQRIEETKEILNLNEFTKIADFLPSRSNIANLCQIFSLEAGDIFEIKRINENKRSEFLVETALNLGAVSTLMELHNTKNTFSDCLPPTLILSYSYFNPSYRELFNKDIKNNKSDINFLKQVRHARFVEQNIHDYNYNIETKVGNYDIDKNILLSMVKLKQNHARFIDFVGYLHSSFESSPFIRVPIRGASLNTYVSRLSPSQYKKINNIDSLRKNIFDIGKALSNNLPSEIVNYIKDYIDCIFSISDLPLEWLLLEDIPLAFLCDICRTPETGLTSILSQYNTNSSQKFQIQKNILHRTLVICGAKKDDVIFETYQNHALINKEAHNLPYKTAHIQSKKDFFEVVNKFNPDLLIIDSHGNFDNQNEGSYIWLGDEKLTGGDIVENLPQVPLVILSCCWGTPIYGNPNTIAQAFFEKGSFSVISTFLPISVDGGFTLYFRVLNNLAYAVNNRVHESWLNLISHNIRTSYMDDLLRPIFNKFGLDILEKEKYNELRLIWQLNCMNRKTRCAAYKNTNQIVLNCIKDSYKPKVEKLLKTSKIIPEFMLYTHLGRGDLIKFC